MAQITIEECVAKAEAHYPLIRKYELLEATHDIDLSEINKSWLPRIGVYGQLTTQNVVPSYPESLTAVLEQMGKKVKGLSKVQYKVGADISQTIWDGGTSKARREMVTAQDAVRNSSLELELYAVRQRVESTFFAILLTEEQISQGLASYDNLMNNLARLKAMQKNGVAMQSDVDMVEAQALLVNQGIIQAQNASEGYRQVLEIFTGESLAGKTLATPSALYPLSGESERPELKLFDRQLAVNNATAKLTDSSLMPKIGFFAQAYYGYPGLDYFKSMMTRVLSFNILAGIKVSWNIDAFYSKKNNAKLRNLNAREIASDRETFLFNSDIQATMQRNSIDGLRGLMKDDARIISLRENVRKVAESQLRNGVIDVTALLTKIYDENMARLNAGYHKIQYLQQIYNLKYTLNK